MAPAGAVGITAALCERRGALALQGCFLSGLCKDLGVAVASGAEEGSAGVTVLGVGTSRSLWTGGWFRHIPVF